MQPMDGIRVLEVASWTFVPAAGAILADWGADVIKIEHPEFGDPQRALMTSGLLGPGGEDIINFMIEQPNRSKRSIGIDIKNPEGWELLMKLVKESDVFLTNFLPSARKRLGIDIDDIRAVNPEIVYVRGHGQGPKGPDADRGAYDAAAFWSRGGVADTISPQDRPYPIMQSAGFGDMIGAQVIAGGIAAALFKRERTGETSVVDVSLLHTAMWLMSFGIVAADTMGIEMRVGNAKREKGTNPLVGTYKTKDDRYIMLVMLQSDPYWADFCGVIGRKDLITNEDYVDSGARQKNAPACIAELDAAFAQYTFEEWNEKLDGIEGVWAPVQSQGELLCDTQALENHYLMDVKTQDGERSFKLVTSPAQFDECPPDMRAAPELGQHTEEYLLSLGIEWDDIAKYKDCGAIT